MTDERERELLMQSLEMNPDGSLNQEKTIEHLERRLAAVEIVEEAIQRGELIESIDPVTGARRLREPQLQ
jgi:hypothetical protein